MKEKMINRVYIEGTLYQHNLEKRVTGENSKKPGTEYIRGTIDIATNDALTNIVQVHYTYVTKKTSKGGDNATYATLNDILEGNLKTYMDGGNVKVRADSALALNEFYTDRQKDANGQPTLVSQRINQGGFIHVLNKPLKEKERERSLFEADMVINRVIDVEEDPDRNQPRKLILKGVIFDFRNAILPMEFTVLNEGGIDYFLSQDISPKNLMFTKITGTEVSETVVRKWTEESAWGEDLVHETTSTNRAFIVTQSALSPYEVGEGDESPEELKEKDITKVELKEKMQEREMMLAELKSRVVAPAPKTNITNKDFDF